MDPEIKKLVEDTHALARDTHRLVRAMRRDQWVSFFARIVIWAIVLLLPLYIYQQYFYPILSKFSQGTTTSSSGFLGLPSVDIQKLINSYTTGQ